MIPVIFLIVPVVLVVAGILLYLKIKRKKQKVIPITETLKAANEEIVEGVRDIIAYDEEEVTMTRAKSYEVLVPKGETRTSYLWKYVYLLFITLYHKLNESVLYS